MTINEQLKIKIRNEFGYSDIIGVVEAIISRIEGLYDINDLYEAISQAIDDELIYYDDQWEVLKYYFSPTDLDLSFGKAIEFLIDDIYKILYYNQPLWEVRG